MADPCVIDIQQAISGKHISLHKIKEELQRGDIVRFKRGRFSHYAMYYGQVGTTHMVIDIQPLGGTEGKTKARIGLEPLDDVAGRDEVEISNLKHDNYAGYQNPPLSAKSPDEVVKSAENFLGMKNDYSLDKCNCEYYCTLWRYGTGFSIQVDEIECMVLGTVGISFAISGSFQR